MKTQRTEPALILDDYFKRMDRAALGEASIFPNEATKERHESILMYALRKYRAASYHFENVRRFLATESFRTDGKDLLNGIADLPRKVTAAKVSSFRDADHFIYELAAFFEAAKSSLDFLATACSVYRPGSQTDSISTFIRLVDKAENASFGPIYDAVEKHLLWLKRVREYRHHLVHRMVITASIGQATHRRASLAKTVDLPVIVPESTPSFYPDTRRSMAMKEHTDRFDVSESMTTVTRDDGTTEITEFPVNYRPSLGYSDISDFMLSHLKNLENFIEDVFIELETLDFKKVVKSSG